jgi:hypothetical protein
MVTIIPFFDFVGSSIFANNHIEAVRKLTASGCSCLTVEAVLRGKQPVAWPEVPGHRVHHAFTNSILWHKEAFINLAVDMLEREGNLPDNIMWIDSGCYLSDGFLPLAIKELERSSFIQPFSKAVFFDQRGKPEPAASILRATGWVKSLECWVPGRSTVRRFNFGGAWAAKTTAFKELGGLPPYYIVGRGDGAFVNTVIDYSQYARPGDKHNRHPLGSVPGTFYHLWHMHHKQRRATYRRRLLPRFNFDPATDVHFVDGVLEWTDHARTHKSRLIGLVARFINGRQVR